MPHFRVDTLREVRGWDAWNVAEDADIGLRIARTGAKVADLPSTTQEEAPIKLRGWFAQRRRWHKGFIQTMITHASRTRDALNKIGLTGWLAGFSQIAGSLLGALFYPLFALHLVWNFWTGAIFDNGDTQALIRNTLALWVASCGVMVTLGPGLIGLRRREAWHLAPWLITMPVYQVLISVAAWMAILDYIRAPSLWLKTEHGQGKRAGSALRSKPETRS